MRTLECDKGWRCAYGGFVEQLDRDSNGRSHDGGVWIVSYDSEIGCEGVERVR